MNTYYRVVTRITDKKSTICITGKVYADERPENTCTETSRADIYEDYFCSKGEAELFVRSQKSEIERNY